MAGAPFAEGDSVLVYDHRDKQYLVTLDPDKQFHYDRGVVPHADIIGSDEGATLTSSMGSQLIVVRPRLADYVLRMKRGAAVMYPKDYGAMITWADVATGDTVVEAGTGSGALTLALSRAVGPNGRVLSFDLRQDHQTHAGRLIASFTGTMPTNIVLKVGDVADHMAEVTPDRVMLDLPEPWHVIEPAAEHLAGGGSFAAYLPTVPQVQQLRDAIDATGRFFEVDTFEIMMRSWSVTGRSVRPEHRMVGHTGFITVARRRLAY